MSTKLIDASQQDVADALLRVRHMSISFGKNDQAIRVVQDVTFHVAHGETLGIVGESGCGKSVTVRALTGLIKGGGFLSGGSIVFDGVDFGNLPPRKQADYRGRRIALISQEPMSTLDPTCTVGRYLSAVVRNHRKIQDRPIRERVIELLEAVQISDPVHVMDLFPHQISGGMAQRVAIAAAIAGDPQLLIADEPTTALDVTVQAEILDVLRAIQKRTGMAMIIVSHDWGVIADLCDRVLVMYAGQVVEEGPIVDLVRHPRHPYSDGLLKSAPEHVAFGERLQTIAGAVPDPLDFPPGCRFADRCESARSECRHAPVALKALAPDRSVRCLFPVGETLHS